MGDDTRAGLPAAGWLHDSATGQTRWWNGSEWTDHTRPLDPVVRTMTATRPPTTGPVALAHTAPAPPTSRNGPAKAALVLLLISVLAAAGLAWLATGMTPTTALVVGVGQIAVLVVAFVLSIVGLAVALLRPTRKREAVIGLVLSTALLGFVAFRIATAPAAVDASALESEIAAWAIGQTGEVSQVTCPASIPQTADAVFTCAVVGESGAEWEVAVRVQADAITWEPAP